jgi:hypothetical protein
MGKTATSKRNVISLPANSSLWHVETALIQCRGLPSDDPVILLLPRQVHSNLFVDLSIARLITTLARRPGRLVVRDYQKSWLDPVTKERFLTQIDGLAALVHCSQERSARLENLSNEVVPSSFLEEVQSRLLKTALVEEGDTGPSRTYSAVDPDFPVPRELAMSSEGFIAFQREIKSALKQFGSSSTPTYQRRQTYEEALYRAVFEIFQNTYEHGRKGTSGEIVRGLRYVRFRSHIGISATQLASRTDAFEPLTNYFKRRAKKPGAIRFLEISISDDGVGILTHFQHSKSQSQFLAGDQADSLNQIITEGLSSKRMRGSGQGLPQALSALSELNAFVALRTENSWLYRDFSETWSPSSQSPLALRKVPTAAELARVEGTLFVMLLDFDV